MKLTNLRQDLRAVNKKLKRARRLYVRLIWPHVTVDHSLLWKCAEQAIKRGLWAETNNLKDMRYRLLRGMAALDGMVMRDTLKQFHANRMNQKDWWSWLNNTGWGLTWHDSQPPLPVKEVI